MVYDSNEKLISILKGERDSYYLEAAEIPTFVKDIMIITEDRRFYKHKGIDMKGTARAVLALVKNDGKITQGASTITQQLSRNMFLSHDRTWKRKIKEMFISMELEKKYSKEQILEFYLNNIYFANGYYGIEGASRGYFSCSASELSMAQMAFLCAIPNSPTRYDPLENFDATNERKVRLQIGRAHV